jgi:phospholipase/lecithinase/hemolysin
MKNLIHLTIGILLFGLAVCPVDAAFTSLYVFGDGVCTTTTNGETYPYSTNYYGERCANGRVWVEVLAQELGLTNNYWYSTNISNHVSYTNLSASSTNWSYSSNNWSYFGHYSSNLVLNVSNFPAPSGASNALFIVWVNDADFVNDMGDLYNTYGTNISRWTNAVNQSLTNHWKVITNLYYAKGARTLVMPNAVDITEIPQFDNYPTADKCFIRQRVIGFNTAFTAMLSNAMVSHPGLKIYEPDFFTLLDKILTNAAAYGLTNALFDGVSIDATEDLTGPSMNGPGANYIFWDATDPTAKVHEIMADVVHQLISPVQISQLTVFNCSNRLDVVNVPVGLNGFVDGCTNLALTNWTVMQSFSSTNTTQSIVLTNGTLQGSLWSLRGDGPPGPGTNIVNAILLSQQYFRLRFPFSWTWP